MRVALGGIIIGVLVMIVAISVVVGFKQEITQKVAGFGSHIQVVNFDNNSTYELQPNQLLRGRSVAGKLCWTLGGWRGFGSGCRH